MIAIAPGRNAGTRNRLRATFEQAARTSPTDRYVLRLYVTGMSARSAQAIEDMLSICDEYLDGRYDLEVIDTYQRAALANGGHMVFAPTGELSGLDLVRYGCPLARRRA